jgi:hypothetical protein
MTKRKPGRPPVVAADDDEELPMRSSAGDVRSLRLEEMTMADVAFLRVLLQLERDARAGDTGALAWLVREGYHGRATEFRHAPHGPAKR